MVIPLWIVASVGIKPTLMPVSDEFAFIVLVRKI
jgi:hypothetical protein